MSSAGHGADGFRLEPFGGYAISHCGLTVFLPVTIAFELHFIFLLDTKTWVKCLLKSFICFSIGSLIDLRSYPEHNYLSGINIANIVSHSGDCFFMFKKSRSLAYFEVMKIFSYFIS